MQRGHALFDRRRLDASSQQELHHLSMTQAGRDVECKASLAAGVQINPTLEACSKSVGVAFFGELEKVGRVGWPEILRDWLAVPQACRRGAAVRSRRCAWLEPAQEQHDVAPAEAPTIRHFHGVESFGVLRPPGSQPFHT